MAEVNNHITFCSYNLNNYSQIKYELVKEIFNKCSFLLLQETWHVESEFIRKFKNDFPNSECISASKMDLDGIKVGRPYGGLAICYHSRLKCKVEYINTQSKSICALKIYAGNISLLLVNIYMPSSDKREAIDEYSVILQEVSSICIKSTTQYIILGGDWNADMGKNNMRTTLFKDFISDENLINSLELDIANVPYTYENMRVNPPTFSTLDHFLISPNLRNMVISYETLFLHNDFSDHYPLKLTLDINIENFKTDKKEFIPCVAWHKCTEASKEWYKEETDNALLQINPNHEALRCRNRKCSLHTEYIYELHKNIIKICKEASTKCFPHTSLNDSKKVVPGWNEHVREHAENAKMWHDVWVQSGKPRQGDIANMKRKSRLKYHYAIRHVTKENIRIRNFKMAEAISNNNDRVLWDEVRKMSKTSNNLPNAMDGVTGTDEICSIFADKYDLLYNSVGYSMDEMNRVASDIESRIDNSCSNHIQNISVQNVKDGISKLKLGKKEENGLFSNHFIYGSNRLLVVISLLFNSMLIHGIAPDDLLLGTMIPLIKNSRGSKQSSDNYRSLTIGTSLSKLLDIVILNRQADVLDTSELQFGFKEKSSTTMCTFMVLETIAYYKSRGSKVHMVLLDASKAFDRVDYIKLFDKLIDRGMCPLTVRLLLNMYTHQQLQVKWNSCKSPKFKVTNGVRQGGVLSPRLFSVYIDELLERLKINGVGCHIGHNFIGALGYADDIVLLCPSLSGLKDMIQICEEYAKEHNILFNGKKSKYLIFGKYEYNAKLLLNNEVIPRCDSAEHLGHFLHTKDTNNELTKDAITAFHKGFHSFMSRFSGCSTISKNKLLHQYCRTMYGSQLWLLSSQSVANMCTQWRKAHRQALSLPYRTHCDLIPLIAENVPIEIFLDCKFLAFYKSAATSNNSIVKYIATSRLFSYESTMGRNMIHLLHKYNLQVEDVLSLSKNAMREHCYQKWKSEINQEYVVHAQIVKEFIMVKEDRLHITFTNNNGVFSADYIIDSLCTN